MTIILALIWEGKFALIPVALEAVGPCSSASYGSHGDQAPVQVAQGLLGATRTAPHHVCDAPYKHSPWQNPAKKTSATNGVFRNAGYLLPG